MDLSAKVLREVEFRDRLRGYDTDEVDEFLEKVAVAVEEMQEKMRQLTARAERAERAVSDRAADDDDGTIRRTLVLAQRTADLAVREAQEQSAALVDEAKNESDKLLSEAKNESEKLLSEARDTARRLASEAERRHSDDITRLERQRDQVRLELNELSELLDSERKRLADSLRAALGFVERTLPAPGEISELRPVPASFAPGGDDDIEAQIKEDAEAAAPSVVPAASGGEDGDSGETARANLAAVPPLDDSGPPTQAWQAEPMTIFGQGGDKVAGAAVVDPAVPQFGVTGPDWIA